MTAAVGIYAATQLIALAATAAVARRWARPYRSH